MKAFVKYGAGPYESAIQKVRKPKPHTGEVLIRVAGCGICGSDLHAYQADAGYEWVRPPVILGHEFTGVIESAGPGVERFRPGDRVAVIGIQGCLECSSCRDGRTNLCTTRKVIGLDLNGGMADYAVVNEAFLVRIPGALDIVLAAMTEPLSVAVHAMEKAGIRPGDRVAVTGAGPIGIMCAMLARMAGAGVVLAGTDADEHARFPVARELGLATINVESERLATVFSKVPRDIWVEASGSMEALKASIEMMPRGGRIVVVAMYSGDMSWLPTVSVRAEHTYHFSYASSFRDYRYALDLLASGRMRLEPLAARFPLDSAAEAFEAAGKGLVVKPVLVPGE